MISLRHTGARPAGYGLRYFYKNRYLYSMLVPVVAFYLIFHYLPMYGVLIAFKDFYFRKGILGSPWVGLKHFEYLFTLDKFKQVFSNTVVINLYRLVFGFPAPILVSLLLNEMTARRYKRFVQTVIYLPHFISWVVISGFLLNLLSLNGGVVNALLAHIGIEPIGFLSDEKYFRSTLVFSNIWKEFGWGTLVYMAALSGISPDLYEAATVDGANRFQRMLHITLPLLVPTIVTLLILRVGQLMNTGFEQVFVMNNPAVYRVADIIDTYAYRIGLSDGRYSLASALGLFKSVINCALLVSVNFISKRAFQQGIV